jgi:hypothetical protein
MVCKALSFSSSHQNIRIVEEKKSIEDFPQTLQVDFANKYIGGGVLSGVS